MGQVEYWDMGWLRYSDGSVPDMPNSGMGRMGRLGPGDKQARVRNWDPVKIAPLIQTVNLPDGDAGTAATIGIMTDLAVKAARDPQFVMIAQEVVRGIPSKDYEGEARRIYEYVDKVITFRNDPRSLEFISAPYYLLMVRGEEDCESIGCLITAIGMSVNLLAGYLTFKCDPQRPDDYSHVCAVLGWPTPKGVKWANCDTTYQGADRGFGWAPSPSKYWASRFWPVAT